MHFEGAPSAALAKCEAKLQHIHGEDDGRDKRN